MFTCKRYFSLLFLLFFSVNLYAANCGLNVINKKNLAYRFNKNLIENPKPVSSVHVEGELPSSDIYINSILAFKNLRILRDASLAWSYGIQSDSSFKQSHDFIIAWTNKYSPNYNPIDENNFIPLFNSYAIVRKNFSLKDRDLVDKYLRNWAYGYVNNINLNYGKRGGWVNNWNSYRVRIITRISYAINDQELIDHAIDLYKKQISNNIDSNGVTVDFKERDAIHYVVFNLIPLVDAAILARDNGMDLYNWVSPNGTSLKKAVDWLAPYIDGEKQHDEFVHTKVNFDKVRQKNGIKGFSGTFNPKSASDLIAKVSILDPSYKGLALKLNCEN